MEEKITLQTDTREAVIFLSWRNLVINRHELSSGN